FSDRKGANGALPEDVVGALRTASDSALVWVLTNGQWARLNEPEPVTRGISQEGRGYEEEISFDAARRHGAGARDCRRRVRRAGEAAPYRQARPGRRAEQGRGLQLRAGAGRAAGQLQ